MSPEPTVWVVDDDAAMRNALRWLIESIGLTVRVYPTAEDFLAAYDDTVPGCLVSDVRMPGMSGLDLQAELARRGRSVPIIFLTAHGEIPMAVHAIQSGAVDFIEKPFSNQLLLDRIKHALARDKDSRVAFEQRQEVVARLARLSAREREVLDQIVRGKANKEIAAELNVSVKTVEFHRAHVMQKMGADSLASLITAVAVAR